MDTRCAAAKLWWLSFRVLRRALGAPAQELMHGEGDFVGVRCAPGNDALELDGILSDGADFHQLSFDDLRVSHRTSSMAHGGTIGTLVGSLSTNIVSYSASKSQRKARDVVLRPSSILSHGRLWMDFSTSSSVILHRMKQ
ncbi:MAG: hypothetical protein WB579_06515 [Bryobacteraceae bacterium]